MRGKGHAGRGVQRARRIVARRANGLKLRELRHPPVLGDRVAVHINRIRHIKEQIEEAVVLREGKEIGRGAARRPDRIHEPNFPRSSRKAVDAHLVNAGIGRHHKTHVAGRLRAGDVRSRTALRNRAESLVVDLVHDGPDRAVRIQTEYREFSVMIARGIEILALLIHADMVRPHAVHLFARDAHQPAVRQNAERDHAIVLHGVEHAPVTRYDDIGGIVHFHFRALLEAAVLHIHIEDCDALCLSRIGVGSHIRHIVFHCLSSPRNARKIKGFSVCFLPAHSSTSPPKILLTPL